MERFQKPISMTGRSLGHENLQGWGRGEGLEIVSDSSSCSGYSTEEDSFSYKLRPRSALKQASEAPIKKLLAEELSNKMEPKRRTPSVIGRLMGLDPLPPQQPVKKQPKKFSENYLKKTASIGYLDKRSSYEGLSGRRRNKEQQEFKDVFEVLDSSRPQNHPNLLMRERATKKLNETTKKQNEIKMEFVRQKFMDAKRLSTDEKLQQSKEFHDALEILDSNKDLLLKFLQEPDPLFAKHLHDLRVASSPSQSGHITVLHSSNARKKADRNTEQNDLASSLRKHDQGAITNSRRKNVYIPSKLPKSQSHEKGVASLHPTRIVVLKPNLKKAEDTVRPVSSPDSLEGFHSSHRKKKEFGGSESFDLYEEVRHRRDSSFDLNLMKHATQESRNIAKEVARQMMYNVTSGSKMAPRVKVRGYAGDESPYSMSGNDSVYEFEAKTPTSKHFNDWKRYNSYSTESSVSREAKKRLSERWMLTRKAQEGKVSRGSTLGEMLAKPEIDTRSTNFDPSVSPDGFGDRLSINGGVTRCGTPLGISSRDGWKDECLRSLPRSRSLPASSTCFSPKTSIRYGFLGKDRCPMPKDSINWRLNNLKKVDSEQIDGLFFKNDMKLSRNKSPYSFHVGEEKDQQLQDFNLKPDEQKCMYREENHPLQPDDVTVSFEGADLSEASPSTLDIPVDDRTETTISVNDHELSVADTSNPEPEKTPVHPSGGSSMCSHCTVTEVESRASSKKAEQPSPDSVLEPPFAEEFSPSSDSFEKISADLHGLRMQLNLLKLDSDSSDTCSEGTEMIVSSDEDIREVSQDLPVSNRELNASVEVNKGYSYLVDALVDSGFHDADLDTLLKTWYSPELPVAPSVFDKLEKKYEEQPLWLRSDRKLLFDRINLGLVELLRPHMDPHPWVKKTSVIWWNEGHLVQELWSLLAKQEKEVAESSLETAMMKEMNWFDTADDLNAVGNRIGRLLFDDLVAEVVGSL